MRQARIKSEGEGYYHIINRMAGQRMLLTDVWKARLLDHVRRAADFSGVEVLTYAIMGNHFHLLVKVQKPREILDTELVARMASLYTSKQLDRILADWERWENDGRNAWKAEDARNRLRKRMFDLSQFVKTFSERFTVEYNRTTGFTASPWGQRFKSVLVEENSRALLPMAAYIDLNPVRAGIATDAGQSAWTGFGAALRGDSCARNGISSLLSYAYGEKGLDWEKSLDLYRSVLDGCLARDGDRPQIPNVECGDRPRFDAAEVEKKIVAGETLALFELLRCRVRQFCAGLVFGTEGFVKAIGKRLPGRNRPPYGIRCAELAGVGTARRVKRNGAISVPK